MIRTYFGLSQNPFCPENVALLDGQREILETLLVHCQQGGFCLVLGDPGSGKSTIKNALKAHDTKRLIVPVVSRTLHTYRNTLRILCQSLGIEDMHDIFKSEKKLIEEAFRLNRQGKMLAPVIDDAHLMDVESLRRLRLLFEDFPKNHNLVLFGQPALLQSIALGVNEDIKSRVTYSTIAHKLLAEDVERFVLDQLDRAGLGHDALSEDALGLVARSSQGVIRKARNLTLSCLVEAVRDQKRTVTLEHVNRVLVQPHWRNEYDMAEH